MSEWSEQDKRAATAGVAVRYIPPGSSQVVITVHRGGGAGKIEVAGERQYVAGEVLKMIDVLSIALPETDRKHLSDLASGNCA